MLNKGIIISILAVISMVSASTNAAERGERREPNPPRYGGDNSSPDRGDSHGIRPGPGHGPDRGGDRNRHRDGGHDYGNPYEPGPRPGPRPRPEPRPPRPVPPPRPTPPPYYPPPEYGDVRREIYLNRNFGNETLNLRRLAGLGYEFSNFSVASVEVQLNSGRYANADLQLRLNGFVEDSQRANRDYISLRSYSNNILGSNLDSLLLDIRGVADVRMITVVLRDRGGYNPGPRIEEVNVSLYRSVGDYERINLSQYVDMRRYAGWTLDSMSIVARANGRTALMDVLVQGMNQATLTIDPYNRSYMVGFNGRMIVDSWTSIELLTRGYMSIDTVTLRLVRR